MMLQMIMIMPMLARKLVIPGVMMQLMYLVGMPPAVFAYLITDLKITAMIQVLLTKIRHIAFLMLMAIVSQRLELIIHVQVIVIVDKHTQAKMQAIMIARRWNARVARKSRVIQYHAIDYLVVLMIGGIVNAILKKHVVKQQP